MQVHRLSHARNRQRHSASMPPCVEGEAIVKIAADTLSSTSENRLGGRVLETFELDQPGRLAPERLLRLKFGPGTDMGEKLRELNALSGVAYAVPNEIIRLHDVPTSKPSSQNPSPGNLNPDLWGMHNLQTPGADISALKAWEVSHGSRQNGPLIAVIDSGVDYHHPDLAANIAVNTAEIPGDGIDNDGNGVVDDYYGYNAYDNNGDPLDRRGHGSHVSGTIAASGASGNGVYGVNWEARLLPVKIFNDQGETTVDGILRGLQYAKKRGAFITSNSWGGANFNPAIYDAFRSTPGLHVTAAGNDGADIERLPSFPANFDLPNIITVGATDRQDQPAVFSNFGRTTVELFAPGHQILSTMPGGGFGVKSGTSMACPHVTGAAALLKTVHPELTAAQIKDRLVYSSDPVAGLSDKAISGGRLNAFRALSSDTTPPASPNDFHSTGADTRSATFAWTATGDDGWKNGAASGFEVRVLDRPVNEDNWAQAAPLPTPRGKEIGDFLSATYQQSPQRDPHTLYAGLKVVDEAANRSKISRAQAVLPSIPVVAEDSFDGPTNDWQGSGRWQRVSQPGRGMVWSCQPAGPADGSFARLTSPEYDLSGSQKNFLRFESRQDFDYDNLVYVDISVDGGHTWKRLDRLEDHGEWKKREYDLSPYDGQKVRFQISSETLATRPGEGTMLDNFEILGEPIGNAGGA